MDLKLLFCLFILIQTNDCKKAGDYPGIQSNTCGTGNLKPGQVISRIVRGVNATLGEFPWMVLVHSLRQSGQNYLDHFCGGALISERFAVTVANCFLFPGFSPNVTKVLAGTIDRSSDDYIASVLKVIIHESFNWSDPIGKYFDIALLELSNNNLMPQHMNESDPKSYIINTVCLPEKGLTSDKGRALFSGFGEIVEHPNPEDRPNMFLTKAEYNIEDSSNCNERQLCGHESAHPSCFRDAGSPLVQFDGEKAVLIGLLATVGNESRDCGKNWQHFTRVSYFIDWIRDKIVNITEEEEKNEQDKNPPKRSTPSLFVIIAVFLIVCAVTLCLTVWVLKQKHDSDKRLENPTKTSNNNKNSTQDKNKK